MLNEDTVEQAALAWLESIGWQVHRDAEIAPGESVAERGDYRQVVLVQRLRDTPAGSIKPCCGKNLGKARSEVVVGEENKRLRRRAQRAPPARSPKGSIHNPQ